MPSMEESMRQVKESLAKDFEHNDILAGLQDEIDKHNAIREEARDELRRHRRDEDVGGEQRRSSKPARFRFKSATQDTRRSKRRSRRHSDEEKFSRKRHKGTDRANLPEDGQAAHPFPREPTDPDAPMAPDAFQDSLFDALAHDEGAQYWESVYSQPIHVYSRPTVQTEKGDLEQMTDEQYTDYVKIKMWERKHPEEVLEREKAKKRRKEEEEEKTRRREDFVRRKEQQAWEEAQRWNARRFTVDDEDDYCEHSVPKDWETSSSSNADPKYGKQLAASWERYLADWDKLKLELLDSRQDDDQDIMSYTARIPWPVLNVSKPVIKPNIEFFMRGAPTDGSQSRLKLLKAERVRWHPDKIQQRFGGKVDEGTMKIVTGVFQAVDALFEEERQKSG